MVGSHEALGAWSTAMALPLTTSADTFPTWQSKAVPLLAGMMVEYKFIIMREDRQGSVQWQKFEGNYLVTPVSGELLQAASDWEVANAEISVVEQGEETERARAYTEEEKSVLKQEKEEVLLKMAESSVEQAAAEVTSTCPLAVTLKKREMSRRNFSQSLMTLDVDVADAQPTVETVESSRSLKEKASEKDLPKEAKEPEAEAETVSQSPMDEEDYEEPLKEDVKVPDVRGVSLKHITPLGMETSRQFKSSRSLVPQFFRVKHTHCMLCQELLSSC